MKRFFVIVMALIVATGAKAQEWKTVSLMDKVSISLPGIPKEDNTKGIPVQKVLLDDSSEISAALVDYSVFGMNEEMLQKMAGTDEFKQQMEAGVGMQPGVTLVKNEAGKYADKYHSYDMMLDVEKDGKKASIQTRTVFYKQYGITVTYKAGQKGTNTELKDKAFNSIKITE